MASKPHPNKLTGSGGLTLSQIHQQVKLAARRDHERVARNRRAQKTSRWQRVVRYVWDKQGKS